MKLHRRTIADQPSWLLRSRQVELAVTELGGHMAPVTFLRDTARPVQPYYIAPWHGETPPPNEPVLVPLRGDFFCLPFGAGSTVGGVTHPTHGEPATRRWTCVGADRADGVTSLTLSMRTRVLPGKVTKDLYLVDGHNVVYVQHLLAGFSCRTTLGHHATLAMPAELGGVRVAHSPARFGLTCPTENERPEAGSYASVQLAKRFRDLSDVPLRWKDQPRGDFSRLPAREGFTDLLAVFAKDAPVAWAAATFARERYLWFSLKDPAVLPTLLLWVSNRGRHAPPWNGRNRCLGMEDVCGFLAEGRAASLRPNALLRSGVPTWCRLSPKTPTVINYIEGVTRVPRGFGRVAEVELGDGQVTFHSEEGQRARAAVCHEFVQTGRIA